MEHRCARSTTQPERSPSPARLSSNQKLHFGFDGQPRKGGPPTWDIRRAGTATSSGVSHRLTWYLHRLRAMDRTEMRQRLAQHWRRWQDTGSLPDFNQTPVPPAAAGSFPTLPPQSAAPEPLRTALARDVREITAGRWRAFGHLLLAVDDPPRWHKDYFVGRDLATARSAFRLNHRQLPAGADIKLIWELSRWQQLVRLAQGAWLLNDQQAAELCLRWLGDWLKFNRPYKAGIGPAPWNPGFAW